MNVLLIGSGGREHAIAWKLSQSSKVNTIFVAPGNGGTAGMTKVQNVDISDYAQLVSFAQEKNITLVIPGPEQPLVDGISEMFKKVGIPCFGPSQKAAQIEGSKAFSKHFMKAHGIPTADYQVFTQFEEAKRYIESVSHRVVLKASGLAAGKGVLIPLNKQEAISGLEEIMVKKSFGNAGTEVVIEEYLEGEECSILAFTDGYSIVALPPSQDHKRAFNNDEGPNTGGMGAYAPAPVATSQIIANIYQNVLKATVDGMRKTGNPFVGLLYAGIMVTNSGIKVLEFNCRFGDPETQVVIPLLSDDSDLFEIMLACAEHRLDSVKINFRKAHAATVVAASGGYPGSYQKGDEIQIDSSFKEGTYVFHAGTKRVDDKIITNGGRVLSVTGIGATLKEAVQKAYATMASIHFKNMHLRTDIAHRALNRSQQDQVLTYADAGVSIDNGNLLVEQIKALTASTRRPGSDAEIGGFGGLFDLAEAGYNSSETVLVSSTDGVGTKLRIAHMMNRHDTIGIDLVAMNVNDLVVQGAEPLFFLDYFACSKLDVAVTRDVVAGISAGCIDAQCALVGGETAEMPGFYADGDYDLAGFTVGAVKKSDILPFTNQIQSGDVVIGIGSSGVHSNGYSLVRHVISKAGLDYKSPCPFQTGVTLGDALLTPTRIYVRQLIPIVRKGLIKAMAHITGGGFIDNIPRVLPANFGVKLNAENWPLLPVFKWLKKTGNIPNDEMARTFNCGIGMVLVVAADKVDSVLEQLSKNGEKYVYRMGSIVPRDSIPGEHSVIVENMHTAWN